MLRALRQARLTEAAHFEAVLDIRDAETLRLVNLKHDVAPAVLASTPTADFVDLAVVPGSPPKLWIDLTSYVVMAPNPQTFRLVQDTRGGQDLILETTDRSEMAKRLIAFIAHRAVERDRMLPQSTGFQPREGTKYTGSALWLAWLSGVAAGVLLLFAIGVMIGG